MFDTDFWQEILQTIRRNRWRSLMTAFGVFWGLLMLILLVGVGRGLERGMMSFVTDIPANSVLMGTGYTTLPYQGFRKGRYWTLENDDLGFLRREFGDAIRTLSPMNFAGSADCAAGQKTGEFSVVGITAAYLTAMPQQMLYGRYVNEIDQRERRKVCVIGRKVYETLFTPGTDPCGHLLKAGAVYYTVVGVAQQKNDQFTIGTDVDESLLIPLSTAQLTYGQGQTLHMLGVTLHDHCDAEAYEARISAALKQRHFVDPQDPGAMWSFNMAEMIGMYAALFLGISVLIWIVGAGTLLAGLIGISNIMLVTVRERTQEIGIRRALGARPRTVMAQILSESLVLTGTAGIAGLVLGIWVLALVGRIQEANPDPSAMFGNPQIPVGVAVAALVILTVGGVVAGWMPARRAMKIRAIEALREE